MKVVSSKKYFPLVTLILLISLGSFANAEYTYKPAQDHDSMLTTGSILQHNNRLLTYTSIGTALINSNRSKAKSLFKEAKRLYKEAEFAYRSGQEENAKKLSFKSIATFYESDKAHYGLSDTEKKQRNKFQDRSDNPYLSSF